MKKAVVVLSGGVDSTTLLYHLLAQGYEINTALSFNYGQKHAKELDYAVSTVRFINSKLQPNIVHKIIKVPFNELTYKSSLTGDVAVPEGHYENESMKLTVIPSRNLIFISIASALAITEQSKLAVGIHAGDHTIYPDTREEFIKAAESAIKIGNWDSENFEILAPFVDISKADIIKWGIGAAKYLGISLFDMYYRTWSCYKGGEKACGKCGTCVERLEAFEKNGIKDPIEYE